MHLEKCAERPTLPARPSSLLNQQYDSCLSLPWIQIKVWHPGACHAGCDSRGITPHHSMCCPLPLLLLLPTLSFPLSLPSCHHQLSLYFLPLTLQGGVRSTEEAHFGSQAEGVLILTSGSHVWEQRLLDLESSEAPKTCLGSGLKFLPPFILQRVETKVE